MAPGLAQGRKRRSSIISEPTGLELVTAHAGAITFRLTITGKAAHASKRREGGSAFFRRPDWRAELARLASDASDPGAGQSETESEQDRAIEEELDRGRSILNERLRTRTVNHVCLPWGVSGGRTAAALARLGYRTAIANRWRGLQAVRPGDDLFWLKRLPNRYLFRLPGRGRRLWL